MGATGSAAATDDGPVVDIQSGAFVKFDAKTAWANAGSAFRNTYTVEEAVAETTSAGRATQTVSTGSFTLADGATIEVDNLSWGVFKLADGFKTSSYEGTVTTNVGEGWAFAQDKTSFDKETGEIVVGGKGVAGSGFEGSAAAGMLDKIFAGDRSYYGAAGEQRADAIVLQSVLAKVSKDYSVADAARDMDRMTLVGVAGGTNALAFDLSSYTADVIEHHASSVPIDRGGWWVKPVGMSLSQDDMRAAGIRGGYDMTATGLMGGLDVTTRSGLIFGAALSYLSGDADGQADAQGSSADVSNVGLHLWGSRDYGDLTVTGTLSYLKHSADAKASVAGFAFASEADSSLLALGARAELHKWIGKLEVAPHAGARLMRFDADAYDIKVAGLNAFKVEADKATVFEVPVGVTLSSAFEYERWFVQPYVDFTVRGRFGDTDGTVSVAGATLGGASPTAYDVTGKYTADMTLGYMSTFRDLNLGMSYGVSAGDLGRLNQRLEATLRIAFD